MIVRLPHNGWKPRPYQKPLWDYLRDEGKRAVAVWHRRAGKDDIALHATSIGMHKRVGNYVHCLPEFLQGRRSIWNAVNSHTGMRRIDEAFPEVLRESSNDTTMTIRNKNGSTWSVIGSDTYNTSLVGTSVVGAVFSEYALSNPSAWAYCRPILEENNGWALFITTPRGRNHAHDLYKHALATQGWFSELLTVENTGALTSTQLAEALSEYNALYGDAGEAQYQQEYFCDWFASVLGTYYGRQMRAVRDEGRILEIDALPDRPVHRSWDLGIAKGNDTDIWFFQSVGAQLYVLDHYGTSGVGLEHYAEVIAKRHAERGWLHGTDYVPHDAKVHELGTGRTRVETMRTLGLNPELVPRLSFDDGINAVRRTLPLCVFHPRCEAGGINALELYRREWDDDKKCFRASPLHDWTSNPADSFRYLAVGWRPAPAREVREVKRPSGWYIGPPDDRLRGGIQL